MYKRLRNLIIVGLVLIAMAAGIRAVSTTPSVSAAGTQQEISTVDRGDVAITISATGALQTRQSASLSFSISGQVATVNVAEGDHVLKGQTIATLDNQSYMDAYRQTLVEVIAKQVALRVLTDKPRQVDINVAQANLNAAKASLQAAQQSGTNKADVQISQLEVEAAKNQRWQTQLSRDATNNQKKDLLNNPRGAEQASSLASDNKQNGEITASDYDVQIAESSLAAEKSKGASVSGIASAQAEVTSAQVTLDNLIKGGNEHDVTQATAQLQAAQAALDVAKENLAKTILVAPFDGVVATLNLNAGEMLPSGAAAVLIDTSSFYVDVPVDESDISNVAAGQAALLTFDALTGITLNGKVTQIAPTATKSGDVVTYAVRIEVDPAGKPLLSSMSTTATIITSQANSVVRLRNRFVRMDRMTNKAFARVRQSDGSFKEVEITLGIRNDTYVEVKQGLQVGDVVAVTASSSTGSGGPGGGPGGLSLGGPPMG